MQSELGNLKQDDKPAVSPAEAAAPESSAKESEPSESSLTYKVEELDSALQLFHAYQKMGLASEASAELNKANNCCIELCKGYPNDEGLQQKQLEINKLLGNKTAEKIKKVVVKADPPKKAAKPQSTPVSQASTEPVSTPKKKKRKVSFV